MRVTPFWFRHGINLWPPFLFSGIHVTHLSDDWRHAHVELRLRPWNRNYVGTQFGGSLFAMTDPFWMILLLHQIGREHLVWDRGAEIRFEKPGRGHVYAQFDLEPAVVQDIVAAAAGGDKVLRWFETPIVDAQGETIAIVRKEIYVRKKRDKMAHRPPLDGSAA